MVACAPRLLEASRLHLALAWRLFNFRASANLGIHVWEESMHGRERQCGTVGRLCSACPNSLRLSRACDVVRPSPMDDMREKAPTMRERREIPDTETVMRGEMMLWSWQGYGAAQIATSYIVNSRCIPVFRVRAWTSMHKQQSECQS